MITTAVLPIPNPRNNATSNNRCCMLAVTSTPIIDLLFLIVAFEPHGSPRTLKPISFGSSPCLRGKATFPAKNVGHDARARNSPRRCNPTIAHCPAMLQHMLNWVAPNGADHTSPRRRVPWAGRPIEGVLFLVRRNSTLVCCICCCDGNTPGTTRVIPHTSLMMRESSASDGE